MGEQVRYTYFFVEVGLVILMRVFMKSMLVAVFVMLVVSMVPMSFGAVTVGVKAGDWIKYQISASGDTSEGFGDINQTDWMKGEVSSVSGTSVTMQMIAHYKNGSTAPIQTLVGDVAAGSGDLSFILIPADLKEGDTLQLAMFGSSNMVINDTVSRTYAGASRSANHFGVSASGGGFTVAANAYWDQATGILLELSMSMITPEQNMQVNIKAIETNMWSSGLFGGDILETLSNPIFIISIAAVIIVAIAAGILIARRPKATPAMLPTNVPTTENPT